MKRILAIFVLLSFTCGSSGFLVLLKLQQIQIRLEVRSRIKRGVPAGELQEILMHPANASEFKWEKEDEFVYRGNRFDVVRKKIVSDTSTLYYCLNDRKENNLLGCLHRLIKIKTNRKAPAGHPVKKMYRLYSLLPEQALLSHAYADDTLPARIWHCIKHYVPPAIIVLYPPPRLLAVA